MSFSEWREVKLGDLVEVSSSKRIYAKEYVASGIPFYRSKEIIEKSKSNDVSTELYISKERFNELKNKFGAPSLGDILLTSVGTLGVPYIVRKEEFYFKDGNLTWIKNFKDNCHNKFIFYWLLSPDGVNQINARCIGSTQKALTIDTLKKFELKIPPLDEQKTIAHILSTLDDKIEVNNQINKTLENMAQAYFDDMFPNVAAGDTTIGEYITPKRGKNLLSKDAISGEVPVIAGGLSPATYHNVSNTQSPVITISASGANAGFVNLWTVPVWSSDSSFIDYGMTKDVYFWYVMLKKRQKEIYDSQTGSAQPHIYPKHITIMPTIKLNVDEINLYTKRVTPLFKKIANNLYEISKLQLIRETLLPKLMSGEIRVPMDEEGDLS